jgi:hypothetical protein
MLASPDVERKVAPQNLAFHHCAGDEKGLQCSGLGRDSNHQYALAFLSLDRLYLQSLRWRQDQSLECLSMLPGINGANWLQCYSLEMISAFDFLS